MQDASEPPTGPAAMAPKNKKRPRIDLAVESRERKRGKTMFGLVLGTLNKAKNEDKERNASEAAKKRHLIEQRLQDKLRKETDSVRRAEEAKKDKTTANRKEEELQLKDSIHKLRRTRLPLLANFLLTSDQIPVDDDTPPPPSTNPLAPMPRTHPPPLYYLPAILTPAQETFIQRRQAEVKEATEKEWVAFREERTAGVEEITQLRQRVAEEDARKKLERGVEPEAGERPGAPTAAADKDAVMATEDSTGGDVSSSTANRPETQDAPRPEREAGMEVDKDEAVPATAAPSAVETAKEVVQVQVQQQEHKEEPAPMHADDDDAVEY
ncbi:hypothetical protein BKA93DRAFT_731935 [Sparassis latifolia]